jgi:hypothetical protein
VALFKPPASVRVLGLPTERRSQDLARRTEGLGEGARREVESALEGAFREPDVVSRLTAEVLNSAR